MVETSHAIPSAVEAVKDTVAKSEKLTAQDRERVLAALDQVEQQLAATPEAQPKAFNKLLEAVKNVNPEAARTLQAKFIGDIARIFAERNKVERPTVDSFLKQNPKIESILASNPDQRDMLRKFIDDAMNNRLTDGLADLNKEEAYKEILVGDNSERDAKFAENVATAMQNAIRVGDIKTLNRVRGEINSHSFMEPDLFAAHHLNASRLVDGTSEVVSTYAFNFTEADIKEMKALPIASVEGMKALVPLLAREAPGQVEGLLKFLGSVPSAAIAMGRYLALRAVVNASNNPQEAAAAEIQVAMLVKEIPALALLDMVGEKGVQMIKNIAGKLVSGKVGDIVEVAVIIAGLIAGGASVAGAMARAAGAETVANAAGRVADVASRVDVIASGSAAVDMAASALMAKATTVHTAANSNQEVATTATRTAAEQPAVAQVSTINQQDAVSLANNAANDAVWLATGTDGMMIPSSQNSTTGRPTETQQTASVGNAPNEAPHTANSNLSAAERHQGRTPDDIAQLDIAEKALGVDLARPELKELADAIVQAHHTGEGVLFTRSDVEALVGRSETGVIDYSALEAAFARRGLNLTGEELYNFIQTELSKNKYGLTSNNTAPEIAAKARILHAALQNPTVRNALPSSVVEDAIREIIESGATGPFDKLFGKGKKEPEAPATRPARAPELQARYDTMDRTFGEAQVGDTVFVRGTGENACTLTKQSDGTWQVSNAKGSMSRYEGNNIHIDKAEDGVIAGTPMNQIEHVTNYTRNMRDGFSQKLDRGEMGERIEVVTTSGSTYVIESTGWGEWKVVEAKNQNAIGVKGVAVIQPNGSLHIFDESTGQRVTTTPIRSMEKPQPKPGTREYVWEQAGGILYNAPQWSYVAFTTESGSTYVLQKTGSLNFKVVDSTNPKAVGTEGSVSMTHDGALTFTNANGQQIGGTGPIRSMEQPTMERPKATSSERASQTPEEMQAVFDELKAGDILTVTLKNGKTGQVKVSVDFKDGDFVLIFELPNGTTATQEQLMQYSQKIEKAGKPKGPDGETETGDTKPPKEKGPISPADAIKDSTLEGNIAELTSTETRIRQMEEAGSTRPQKIVELTESTDALRAQLTEKGIDVDASLQALNMGENLSVEGELLRLLQTLRSDLKTLKGEQQAIRSTPTRMRALEETLALRLRDLIQALGSEGAVREAQRLLTERQRAK